MSETLARFYEFYLVPYSLSLISAVIIFVAGKWIAKVMSKISGKALEKAKVNLSLASFTKNVVYFGILTFVLIAALNKIGIQTNPFVALIGAAGLAIGLALQGSLANFAAGVMIIFFQPFNVGDDIEAGGAKGVVKEIQIFHTLIISPENYRVIVPNSKITADKITIIPKK
jgi:small conductance mechanosensitive channel